MSALVQAANVVSKTCADQFQTTMTKDEQPQFYEKFIDAGYLPDFVLREGVRYLLSQRCKFTDTTDNEILMKEKMAFIDEIKNAPIAVHTDKANEQHYEVPTDFMQLCLGPRMKYSCCYFPEGVEDLATAEEAMMELYIERAGIKEGQAILDMGCGWGSLSLFLAERFPKAQITGVSNSATQRESIMAKATSKGFKNLNIITCDINTFDPQLKFDRVVSIEMLEHVKNYPLIFKNINSWLKDDGLFFTHVFSHKSLPYHFKTEEGNSWMARYFFTGKLRFQIFLINLLGGTMPSNDLFLYFQDDLSIVKHWVVDGKHYGKTSKCWLELIDKNKTEALEILSKAYGGEKEGFTWFNRWRLFYLTVEEFFNYRNGNEWQVSHYLFKKKRN